MRRTVRQPFVNRAQHRTDTVLHVKIGFPLSPVAQDFQVVRVLLKLSIKVEHVTMCVSWPKIDTNRKMYDLYP